MLGGVHVEHELGECAVHPRERALHQREAGAGDLRRGLEIEQAEPLAEVDMVLHRKVEAARRTDGAHHRVVVGRPAHRHAVVRHVGHADEEGFDLFLQRREALLVGREFVGEARHRSLERGDVAGVLPLLHCLADLLRHLVAARLQLLGVPLQLLALALQREEARAVEHIAAVGEPGGDAIEVGAQQLDVQHGGKPAMG